jgi:glycosyltransferase involved in cell wall biosynthesis
MADGRTSSPTVSAIIVVRNGEAYLREAIDSIVCQSFTDWELIVVDDGSFDGTAAIVRGYERELPDKIRLINHPDGQNHGISASRNLGLTEVRGRYIGFLDADDVWLPEKLAAQVAIMGADRALGMIYGRTLIWHSWQEGSRREDFYYPLGVKPERRYDPPVLFELLLESKAQTPTTCNALMRNDLFATLGGFDDRFRLMFEDQTFFAKALAFAPAYVSDRTWAKYRQHSQSCSATSASAGNDEAARLTFLRWLNASIAHHSPSLRVRSAIWRTLAKATYVATKRRLLRQLRALR